MKYFDLARRMSSTDTDNCIHGHWEEGVCVCDPGYELGYNELQLNPVYCKNQMITIIHKTAFIESKDFIHIIAMAVS